MGEVTKLLISRQHRDHATSLRDSSQHRVFPYGGITVFDGVGQNVTYTDMGKGARSPVPIPHGIKQAEVSINRSLLKIVETIVPAGTAKLTWPHGVAVLSIT